MVELIPPPDPHTLIPPLLACLPTAFASARPPPVLIELLSPILRQRLQLLAGASSHDNWLRLLCWDSAKGEELKEVVESANFEPHPSSGEVEIGDVDSIVYKRFDQETLRARISLSEWPIIPLYIWCTGSEEGNSWKLAEVLPSEDQDEDQNTWSTTISQANESATERMVTEALAEADAAESSHKALPKTGNDEDDYWAMYDTTPGRTPARDQSVAPREKPESDADYYARYGNVQPAMDNYDPDEDVEGAHGIALNGNTVRHELSQQTDADAQERSPPPYQGPLEDAADEKKIEMSQPVASPPSSRGGSDAIARLERTAERYAASEIALRQHISTTMKSMYRLAKSAGMDREEFDRIVQRELETLSLFDRDE